MNWKSITWLFLGLRFLHKPKKITRVFKKKKKSKTHLSFSETQKDSRLMKRDFSQSRHCRDFRIWKRLRVHLVAFVYIFGIFDASNFDESVLSFPPSALMYFQQPASPTPKCQTHLFPSQILLKTILKRHMSAWDTWMLKVVTGHWTLEGLAMWPKSFLAVDVILYHSSGLYQRNSPINLINLFASVVCFVHFLSPLKNLRN